MKNSEAVQAIDVKSMAEHFGLSPQSIKLAIIGLKRKLLEPIPAKKFSSLAQVLRYCDRLAHGDLRNQHIELAINKCKCWDDFRAVERYVQCGQSNIHGYFHLVHGLFVRKLIAQAQTFADLHEIWLHLSDDYLADVNMEVFQMMFDLAAKTPAVEVFKVLDSDGSNDTRPGSDHFKLLLRACEAATPEQAKEALEFMYSLHWDGTESSIPVRTLIRKVAELYRK